MKRVAAILLVVSAMASCADLPAEPAGGSPQPEPPSITVSATYDESTCCYVEGFVAVVRIVGSGIDVEKEIEQTGDGFADLVLEVPRGGEYSLESWVEPCSGNCGARDAATDHCTANLTVPDGDDLGVDLTIRSTHPCLVSVEGQ